MDALDQGFMAKGENGQFGFLSQDEQEFNAHNLLGDWSGFWVTPGQEMVPTEGADAQPQGIESIDNAAAQPVDTSDYLSDEAIDMLAMDIELAFEESNSDEQEQAEVEVAREAPAPFPSSMDAEAAALVAALPEEPALPSFLPEPLQQEQQQEKQQQQQTVTLSELELSRSLPAILPLPLPLRLPLPLPLPLPEQQEQQQPRQQQQQEQQPTVALTQPLALPLPIAAQFALAKQQEQSQPQSRPQQEPRGTKRGRATAALDGDKQESLANASSASSSSFSYSVSPGEERPSKSPRLGKKCPPKACERCRKRKAKCLRDGEEGSCQGCVVAGVECIREGKDLRQKTALWATHRLVKINHGSALRVAWAWAQEAHILLARGERVESDGASYGAAMALLAKKRFTADDLRLEGVPRSVRERYNKDNWDSAPQVRGQERSQLGSFEQPPCGMTKPALKKHVDAEESAMARQLDGFRRALLVISTPPHELSPEQCVACLGLTEMLMGRQTDNLVAWGAAFPEGQQLLEKWQL